MMGNVQISSVAEEYQRLLDARINFLTEKVNALHCEREQLEKLHVNEPC